MYYTSDMLEKLKLKQIPTLNNTKFALIEFSMQTSWKDIHTALSNVLMLGITPVVAHIERYNALENQKERVKEIINMGCYTQINSSHILKQNFLMISINALRKEPVIFRGKFSAFCSE